MIYIITFGFTFLTLIVLFGGLGLIAVIVAFLVGKTVPCAHDACSKCIVGWTTKRGLRNRLLVAPLLGTLTIFVVFAVIGLVDTCRLRSAIQKSTHIVLRSGGNCHRKPEREFVLLQLKDPEEIRSLSELVSIGLTMPGMKCRCCGDMTFDCYREEELYYSFSFHHGNHIRVKGPAAGDKSLSLASRRKMTDWLDKVGVTKKLEQAREQENQRWKTELEEALSAQSETGDQATASGETGK